MNREFRYHEGQTTSEHENAKKLASSPTTSLVSELRFADGRTIAYEYDAEERITKVTDSVEGVTSYVYDAQGQLTSETKGGVTTTFTYDAYGNLKTKGSHTYGYAETGWRDRLTSFDGQAITYYTGGNPMRWVNHKNNYGYTMKWRKGRELQSVTDSAGQVVSFSYNANGIRTAKNDCGVVHSYLVEGPKILRETYSDKTLDYLYDKVGSICGLILNGTAYYFYKNLQGDVIAITDKDGVVKARYSYDAWGACTVESDTSGTNIASINPFRYRSYYFDVETGFYYLQSRYYDPIVGRFINADYAEIVVAKAEKYNSRNLYIYCDNNPINYYDPSGCNSASISRQAGSAVAFLTILVIVIKGCAAAGSSNFWNPVGWVLLAVAGIALLAFGVWSLAKYLSDKSMKTDLALIASASTAATPPPPNKGGRGTQTSSKTVYNKRGNRIDVENPGNRQGQIHLQTGGKKYYYNVKDQAFHLGSSNGSLAPKSIQALLKDKDVIKAIAKGLRILGY